MTRRFSRQPPGRPATQGQVAALYAVMAAPRTLEQAGPTCPRCGQPLTAAKASCVECRERTIKATVTP